MTMRDAHHAVEKRAWTDLMRAAHERELHADAERVGEALVLRCGEEPSLMFNRVCGLGDGGEAMRQDVDEVVAGYRAARIDRFFVHLSDPHRPEGLVGWLAERGIVPYRRAWDELGRGRDESLPPVATPFEVRRAIASDAVAVGTLFEQGFDLSPAGGAVFGAALGRPGWLGVVAIDEGEVVAAGLLFVDGDVGYLAGGTTRRDKRGHGGQLAVMVERCRLALDLGCRLLVSETGAKIPGDPQHSHRNLERCGFGVIGRRNNYAPDGTLWRHGPPA
jgi:hypothetical protein